MHLITLQGAGFGRPGLLIDGEALDLRAAAPWVALAHLVPGSMRALLEGGDEALDVVRRIRDRILADGLREQLRAAGVLVPRAAARLLAPIPNPGTIIAAGLNSRAHLAEMQGTPIPSKPASLFKSPASVIGPGAPILPPRDAASMIDYEGEFSAVFGRPCHRVQAHEALGYLAGYTLINDVSARDWVAPVFAAGGSFAAIHAWEHNILGKQFPTFCPLGPTIATREALPDPTRVEIRTTLNGREMQRMRMDDLIFSLADLIAYYSRFYRFLPGDVITTGSPAGVGFGRKPPVFMREGDVVEVSMAEIGTLSNPIGAPA